MSSCLANSQRVSVSNFKLVVLENAPNLPREAGVPNRRLTMSLGVEISDRNQEIENSDGFYPLNWVSERGE